MFMKNDPILFFVLPLVSISAHIVHKRRDGHKKGDIDSFNNIYFFDSLTLASIIFSFSYMVLGLYEDRYLLPAYPFCIIAIIGYSNILYQNRSLAKNHLMSKYKTLKISVIIATSILVLNSIFYSINVAIYYKYESYNFTKFNNELERIISDKINSDQGQIRIYYPGWDCRTSLYYARMNLNMLHFIGYKIDEKDTIFERNWFSPQTIKISDKTLNYLCPPNIQNWMIKPTKSDYQNIDVRHGDLFLIMPRIRLDNLEDIQMRCIMRTKSAGYFELPELQTIGKGLLSKLFPEKYQAKFTPRQVDFAIFEVTKTPSTISE